MLLTGTPGHDTPKDMFTLLRFLRPATYTSYWKWVDEWLDCKTIYVQGREVHDYKGIKHSKKKEFAKLMDSIAIQRKRSEVMDWLTEPDIIDIPLPITKQQKEYLMELKDYYSVGDIICQGELDRLIRYRQVCNAPEILGLSGKSPKIQWLKDLIADNPDKSILVFSNSAKMLNLVMSKLGGAIIYGKVLPECRAEIVRYFQAGKVKLLLCQTQACKEGLTLDKADIEVFLDVYPPASDYQQAKDRMVITDESRLKPQTIYRLFMDATFDETCYHMVDNHTNECDVINNFRRYLNES